MCIETRIRHQIQDALLCAQSAITTKLTHGGYCLTATLDSSVLDSGKIGRIAGLDGLISYDVTVNELVFEFSPIIE